MSLIPKIVLSKEGLSVFSKETNIRLKILFVSHGASDRKRRNTNTICKTNHLYPTRNHHFKNTFQTCSYIFFFVSDLKDAGPTRNAPCNPETKCKNAYKQNLAGCDAATGRCICSRGYVMSEDICTGRICNSSPSPLHLSFSIYPAQYEYPFIFFYCVSSTIIMAFLRFPFIGKYSSTNLEKKRCKGGCKRKGRLNQLIN